MNLRVKSYAAIFVLNVLFIEENVVFNAKQIKAYTTQLVPICFHISVDYLLSLKEKEEVIQNTAAAEEVSVEMGKQHANDIKEYVSPPTVWSQEYTIRTLRSTALLSNITNTAFLQTLQKMQASLLRNRCLEAQ